MSITTEYFQILILKSNKILKKSEKQKEKHQKIVYIIGGKTKWKKY